MSRFFKSFCVAILGFLSFRYLGFDLNQSIAFASLALIFGVLNIQVGFFYSLTAFSFLISALFYIYPHSRSLFQNFFNSSQLLLAPFNY